MEVRIEGKKLIIEMDIADPAPLSKSGKTMVIASTRGIAKTGIEFNGRPLSIGVNAMVKV